MSAERVLDPLQLESRAVVSHPTWVISYFSTSLTKHRDQDILIKKAFNWTIVVGQCGSKQQACWLEQLRTYLDLQAGGKVRETCGEGLETFVTSKSASNTLSPRPNLLILPQKTFYQLGTKYSVLRGGVRILCQTTSVGARN